MSKGASLEAYPADGLTERKGRHPHRWSRLGGEDRSHVSVNDGYIDSDESSFDDAGDIVRNVNNVFEASEAAELYKPIEGFEGTHRFDPSITWTQEEEKALVRKV